MGRIRLSWAPSAVAASLEDFLLEAVEPGRTVRMDRWTSYSRLEKLGYRHDRAVLIGDRELVERMFPKILRLTAPLKR